MKATTNTPYFKFDAGQFNAETMGYPDEVVGLYIRMMTLYWESGCELPADDILKMKLGVRTKKQRLNLAMVLEHFFSENRRHPRLDACLYEVGELSRKQSERAKTRWKDSGVKNRISDEDF